MNDTGPEQEISADELDSASGGQGLAGITSSSQSSLMSTIAKGYPLGARGVGAMAPLDTHHSPDAGTFQPVTADATPTTSSGDAEHNAAQRRYDDVSEVTPNFGGSFSSW